ncbi:MAG TPA: hypothetical protein VL500_02245 [Candidatus Eisenbacteria bacterium]|nr:hypothetical protein [Candidatus Eisenbacteria bacterium]
MTRRIVLCIIVLIACLVPGRSYAQDTRPSHADVTARIADARRQLAGARIGTTRIGGDNAVLAVWNPSQPSRGVRLVNVMNGTSRTRGFSVEVTLRNGVNSRYRISPEGWQVLAIRTNVRASRRGRSMPATYVPYDPALHTPEMEREGRAYLESLLSSSRARLTERRVASQSTGGRLVHEVIPERVLLSLLVIEHVDPDDFARDGARASMARVFVTAALNRGDAYRYAGSYAGALGLAQFIRGTYDLTRRRYASARLPADFRAGMGDHVSAVTAQYCLADWSLSRLPEAQRTRLLEPANEEELGAFLAAAYNGGEDRAANAYLADRAHWEDAGHGLAGQTVGYVAEFRATYRALGH